MRIGQCPRTIQALVLLVLAVGGRYPSSAAAQNVATLGFSVSTVNVAAGESALVHVNVTGVPAPGLAAFQIRLQFGADIIDLRNPNEAFRTAGIGAFTPLGDNAFCTAVRGTPVCQDPPWFLTTTGRAPIGIDVIDNMNGVVDVAYGTSGGQAPAVGNGTIGLIEVLGRQVGTTTVELLNVILIDNQEPPQDLPFIVSGPLTVVVGPVTPPQRPEVTITSPGDGAMFVEGDAITFAGAATDGEDGDVTASLNWESSINGLIGSGATFTRSDLSTGTHVVSATATDSTGLTGAFQVTITVEANAAPQVSITSPADGAMLLEGDAITFMGTATDKEDGDVTATLSWESSIDGLIGSGATFTRSDLSTGSHFVTATAVDSRGQTGDAVVTFQLEGATPVTIMEIQGSQQFSPFEDRFVDTSGIVTLFTSNGANFWMQDPEGDGESATSDGIFVAGGSFPASGSKPKLGDLVRVTAEVQEQQFGLALPLTRLQRVRTLEVISDGNSLPKPVELKDLPNVSIPEAILFWEPLEGMLVFVERAFVVAPTSRFGEFTMLTKRDARKGSGFFSRLHHLLLQPDGNAGVDYNPERIIVDDSTLSEPTVVRPGDRIRDFVGVVDYTFGNYKLQPAGFRDDHDRGDHDRDDHDRDDHDRDDRDRDDRDRDERNGKRDRGDHDRDERDRDERNGKRDRGELSYDLDRQNRADHDRDRQDNDDHGDKHRGRGRRERDDDDDDDDDDDRRHGERNDFRGSKRGDRNANLRVTTFNVGGLFDLVDEPGKDDEGSTPTPPELDTKLAKLTLAIQQELHSPDILVVQEIENTAILQELGNQMNSREYQATSVESSDARGIEVGFLWDAKRVSLLESFQLSDAIVDGVSDAFGAASPSPGREPLVGIFEVRGQLITIIGNHFKSKVGDDPLVGLNQPAIRSTEAQRKAQARVVRDYVNLLLGSDEDARILVTGDFNDFEFAEPNEGSDHPIAILEGAGTEVQLTNLIDMERESERFTFVFDGNSEVLDHMLVSPTLLRWFRGVDILHFNTSFPDFLSADPTTPLRSSDHDAVEGRFRIRR